MNQSNHSTYYPVCALLMPRNSNYALTQQRTSVCALLAPRHGQNALAVSRTLSVTFV